jgi:hypothetical protein
VPRIARGARCVIAGVQDAAQAPSSGVVTSTEIAHSRCVITGVQECTPRVTGHDEALHTHEAPGARWRGASTASRTLACVTYP